MTGPIKPDEISEAKQIEKLENKNKALKAEGERLYRAGIKLLDAKHASEREAKKWFELYQTTKVENDKLKTQPSEQNQMSEQKYYAMIAAAHGVMERMHNPLGYPPTAQTAARAIEAAWAEYLRPTSIQVEPCLLSKETKND